MDEAATTTTRAISMAMIQNAMIAVNGSIGSAGATALGAVNTDNIVSGVDAAVQGIVGMSGQNMSGL